MRKVWGPIPGPVKSDTALPTAVCRYFEGSWESKLYYTGANKITIAEMDPATRYTLLRITVSIIEVWFDFTFTQLQCFYWKLYQQDVKESRPLKVASCILSTRAGARAVYLGGPSIYQGGAKFEIKHKSRCLKKCKLVSWGTKHVDWSAGPVINLHLNKLASGSFWSSLSSLLVRSTSHCN